MNCIKKHLTKIKFNTFYFIIQTIKKERREKKNSKKKRKKNDIHDNLKNYNKIYGKEKKTE